MLINLMIGGAVALACIGLIHFLFPKRVIQVWSIGIVIAALAYVWFAVSKEAWDFLPMEIGGVVIYSLLAWLSIKYSTYWLALAWALHIAWDTLLHDALATPYVPIWYPSMCIGFDIMIVCYVLSLSSQLKMSK